MLNKLKFWALFGGALLLVIFLFSFLIDFNPKKSDIEEVISSGSLLYSDNDYIVVKDLNKGEIITLGDISNRARNDDSASKEFGPNISGLSKDFSIQAISQADGVNISVFERDTRQLLGNYVELYSATKLPERDFNQPSSTYTFSRALFVPLVGNKFLVDPSLGDYIPAGQLKNYEIIEITKNSVQSVSNFSLKGDQPTPHLEGNGGITGISFLTMDNGGYIAQIERPRFSSCSDLYKSNCHDVLAVYRVDKETHRVKLFARRNMPGLLNGLFLTSEKELLVVGLNEMSSFGVPSYTGKHIFIEPSKKIHVYRFRL